jgi:uncharacterized damage-inducible protein DinB
LGKTENQPEVWQRGPVENIPPLLQPVAHALLQAKEEVAVIMKDFPEKLLWEKPAGLASVGFHLRHLSGVVDRLFTYALNEQLSAEQLRSLQEENMPQNSIVTSKQLIERFNLQVGMALQQLKDTDESTLTEQRSIGRKKIPTTVIGLLVHAAEHMMRHIGQLMVTVRVLKDG